MRTRPDLARNDRAVELDVQAIERSPSAENSIATLVAALQALFGEYLTARVAGVEEPNTVDDWATGRRQPDSVADRRLRNAWRVVDYLLREEGRDTARAWFLGLNPELGDLVPVLTVAEEPDRVMGAARAFVAYG